MQSGHCGSGGRTDERTPSRYLASEQQYLHRIVSLISGNVLEGRRSFGGFNKVVERQEEELAKATAKLNSEEEQAPVYVAPQQSEQIQKFNDELTDISAEAMAQAHIKNNMAGTKKSKKKEGRTQSFKRPREESAGVKASKEWKKKKLPKNL